jgi:hypothetical protein
MDVTTDVEIGAASVLTKQRNDLSIGVVHKRVIGGANATNRG